MELGDYGDMPQDASYFSPPEFTQAHALQLNKLQQADAEADNQLFSGEISQGDHAQWKQIIGGQLAPLKAMQQASQQQQQQEAMGQLMQARALQRGMDQADAEHAAESFHLTQQDILDPMTGQKRTYVMSKPGHFEPVEFEGQEGGDEMPTDAGYLGQEPPTTAADSGTTTAGTPQIEPQPDGSHVMTIINGQNQERWHFSPDGTTTLLQRLGPQADQQSQQGQQGVALNQAELAILRQRARQSVPQPQLTGNQRIDGARMLQWQKAVDAVHSHLVQAEQQRRQNTLKAQDQAGEHARQEESRQKLETQKEDARKEAEKTRTEHRENQQRTEQQLSAAYRHHLGQVRKEIKDGATFDDPSAEAWKRVDEETKGTHARVGGKVPEAPPAAAPKQTTWQWLTGQKPPAPPAPEGKGRTQDFEAYIRKTLGETSEGRKELQRNDLKNVMQGVSQGRQ